MRERLTARVLLLDPQGRILLMKGRLESHADGPGAWFTVGGGANPGETVLAAAIREVAEETGFTDVEFGPVVWLREAVHVLRGERVLFKESYLVAFCAGAEPRRDGWDEAERRLMDDIAWWRIEDLAATHEAVFPPGLAQMLPEIIARRFPDEPYLITA
jgi:8-oxo-dGTP pyrophosphatase MutT (NUDIX family)